MHRSSLLPIGALWLFGFTSLTPEVLECEHAAANLEDCCPEIVFSVTTCTYGGCGEAREPAFDEETSLCLQELSCSQMREVGPDGLDTCERVAQGLLLREAQSEYSDPDDPSPELGPIEGLCP